MIPKALNESAWRSLAQKSQIKDAADLQKALASFAKTKPDEYDDLLKCLDEIQDEALSLKKSKDIASNATVAKYLADILAAATAQQRDITKEKQDAEKKRAAEEAKAAKAQKEAGDEKAETEEEEEADEAYGDKLLNMLKKLKTLKDVAWEFVVCEGKPYPCVMVAKKITPKLKQQLAEIAGTKQYRYAGTCVFKDGKYNFLMEKSAGGLARRLQESIKLHTGKKFPITIGDETAEEDDDKPPAA